MKKVTNGKFLEENDKDKPNLTIRHLTVSIT